MTLRAAGAMFGMGAAALLAVACGGSNGNNGDGGLDVSKVARLAVTSPAFGPGESIPVAHTCDGADTSPPLAWSGAPEGARAYAIVADDPDAPGGTWVHWLAWDLPAGAPEVAEGASGSLPKGAAEGKNSWGKPGYRGPCPPKGKPHRYSFRVYALDAPLGLAPGARKAELEKAVQPHLLAAGELVGLYGR